MTLLNCLCVQRDIVREHCCTSRQLAEDADWFTGNRFLKVRDFEEHDAARKSEKKSRKKVNKQRKAELKSLTLTDLERHAVAVEATEEELAVAKSDQDPKASLINLILWKEKHARREGWSVGDIFVSPTPDAPEICPICCGKFKKWWRLLVVFVSAVLVAGLIPGQASFIQLFTDFGVGASHCAKGQVTCNKQQLAVSLGFNIGQVLSQFGLLIGGWLFDRFGGRVCSVTGGATTMLGLILLQVPLLAVSYGYDEATRWMFPIIICLTDAGSVLGGYSVMSLLYHFPGSQTFIVAIWGVSLTMPALLPNAFIFTMSLSGLTLPSVFGLYTVMVVCATIGLFFCVPTQEEYLQEGKKVLGVPFPDPAQKSSLRIEFMRGIEVMRVHPKSHLCFATFSSLLFSAMTIYLSLMGDYMEILLGSRAAGDELTSLFTFLQGTLGSVFCVIIGIIADLVGRRSLVLILSFLTSLVIVLVFEVGGALWSQQLVVIICVVAIQNLVCPVMGKYCLAFCMPTQLGMFLGVLNTLVMGCTAVVMTAFYTWVSMIDPAQMPTFMMEMYALTALCMVAYTAYFAWSGLPEIPVLLPSDEEVLTEPFGCKTFDEVLYVTNTSSKSDLLKALCATDEAPIESLMARIDPDRQAEVSERHAEAQAWPLLQYLLPFPCFMDEDVEDLSPPRPTRV